MQEKVLTGEIEVTKIGTGDNLADAQTKHAESEILVKHMKGLGVWIESGRHVLMPEVAEQAQEFVHSPNDDDDE